MASCRVPRGKKKEHTVVPSSTRSTVRAPHQWEAWIRPDRVIPNSGSAWWELKDAASVSVTIDRVRTGTEESQCHHVERDDDRRCCVDVQCEPDQPVAEQADRRGNRRHIPRKQGNGQQYCASVDPAGQTLSLTETLDEQRNRDRGPHEQ